MPAKLTDADAPRLFEQIDRLIALQDLQRIQVLHAVTDRVPGWHRLSVYVGETGEIEKALGVADNQDWLAVVDRDIREKKSAATG